jgi:flavin-dependent dehydrogenase
VAIVGGSAAGLFAAYRLARAGCKARVYEGQERLDAAPRSLIVTERMREVLGGVGDRAVVNEIRRFELYTDGRVAKIALRRPDLVIERSVLIEELAKASIGAGARIEFGRKFLALDQHADTLSLTLEGSPGGARRRRPV